MPSKRVVLRVHEQWLDDYLKIACDWLMAHGHTNVKQDTRVGYIGGGRFHIIIDIEEDAPPKPVNVSVIPMEIYRVRRGNDGKQMIFQYIDEKTQPNVYLAVREFGQNFIWGCSK